MAWYASNDQFEFVHCTDEALGLPNLLVATCLPLALDHPCNGVKVAI